MSKFIVYSREDCHLCHDMAQDLRLWQTRLPFEFEVIEIDDDADLMQRYGLMIPVLTDSKDELICYGRLDVAALTAFLQR